MVACGLEQPSSALANTDPTVQQFVTHSLIEGESLARDYDWKELLVEATLTGNGTDTNFDLPSDWDRWASGNVFFKTNDTVENYQRVTQEQMTYLKASTIEPTWPVWRHIGSQIEFFPAIPNGDVLRCEYISSHWVINSDLDTRRLAWASDTDLALVPERLLSLGITWRWRKASGLQYADDLQIYQNEVSKMIGNDAGRDSLHFGESLEPYEVFPSFRIAAA
jgi:hypothetical protein